MKAVSRWAQSPNVVPPRILAIGVDLIRDKGDEAGPLGVRVMPAIVPDEDPPLAA